MRQASTNLVLDLLSFPDSFIVNKEYEVVYLVRNEGNASAEAVVLDFFVFSEFYKKQVVGNLLPGESFSNSFSWIPDTIGEVEVLFELDSIISLGDIGVIVERNVDVVRSFSVPVIILFLGIMGVMLWVGFKHRIKSFFWGGSKAG